MDSLSGHVGRLRPAAAELVTRVRQCRWQRRERSQRRPNAIGAWIALRGTGRRASLCTRMRTILAQARELLRAPRAAARKSRGWSCRCEWVFLFPRSMWSARTAQTFGAAQALPIHTRVHKPLLLDAALEGDIHVARTEGVCGGCADVLNSGPMRASSGRLRM